MTEIHGCGGGGWTLVMKIDGNKVKTATHCTQRSSEKSCHNKLCMGMNNIIKH